jgi:hypothetical protein
VSEKERERGTERERVGGRVCEREREREVNRNEDMYTCIHVFCFMF